MDFNATFSLGTSYDQQDNLQEADYTDDIVNLGTEGCEEGDAEEGGYQQEGEEEEYAEEYGQGNDTEMSEDQMDYTGEQAEGDEGYQDEVLDIQINEPIDGEFQVSLHICSLTYVCICTDKHPYAGTHTFSLSVFFPTLLFVRDNVSSLVLVWAWWELKSIQEKEMQVGIVG